MTARSPFVETKGSRHGAGSEPEKASTDKEAVIRQADVMQESADASEAKSSVHEWNYIYRVRCDNGYRHFTVYNARSKERYS